jgi:hypothetical protein
MTLDPVTDEFEGLCCRCVQLLFRFDVTQEPLRSREDTVGVPITSDRVNKAVRRRDGYECVKCGMSAAANQERFNRTLEVHRRIKRPSWQQCKKALKYFCGMTPRRYCKLFSPEDYRKGPYKRFRRWLRHEACYRTGNCETRCLICHMQAHGQFPTRRLERAFVSIGFKPDKWCQFASRDVAAERELALFSILKMV